MSLRSNIGRLGRRLDALAPAPAEPTGEEVDRHVISLRLLGVADADADLVGKLTPTADVLGDIRRFERVLAGRSIPKC